MRFFSQLKKNKKYSKKLKKVLTNDSESAIIIDVKERKKYQFKKTKSCFVGAKLVIKIFRKFQKRY